MFILKLYMRKSNIRITSSNHQCSVLIFSKKRNDYLHWPDYFMATAFLSAQRSKDPRTQVIYEHLVSHMKVCKIFEKNLKRTRYNYNWYT